MSFSTFSGPIRSGTVRYTTGTTVGSIDNTGVAVLSQSKALVAGAAATTVAVLPAGSQILFVNIDTTTLFNAATTITLGDGTTANKYVTSTTITTATRATTAGVYSEWANIGTSDVTIVATLGGSAVTGNVTVTVVYAQKASDGSEVPSSS